MLLTYKESLQLGSLYVCAWHWHGYLQT